MGQRPSLQDQDGTTWQTVGLPLGTIGLDLRQPITPGSLTKLINARFADERSVARREGHTGQQVMDASDFPAIGNVATVGWVYGHGQQIDPSNAAAWGQAHHPVAGRGRGTFRFDGADVVWTGDRLLALREDGNPALGQHTFWRRDNTTSPPLSRGLPAHLPVQVDLNPPDTISGSFVETCLTSSLRVIAASDSAGKLWGWIIDRTTGAVINKTELGGITGLDQVHVINSGNVPVVIWRNGDNTLCTNYWTGVQWAGRATVAFSVVALDVAAVPGGFHVAWRTGSTGFFVGRYFGAGSQNTPYTFATQLHFTGSDNLSGPLALAVDPGGGLVAVTGWGTGGLYARAFTSAAVATGSTGHQLLTAFPASDATFDSGTIYGGLSAVTRGLMDSTGTYPTVVYAGGTSRGVHAWEIRANANESLVPYAVLSDDHRWNSALATHAFRVGDEVFCWLRALNANTHYLVAGVHPQICGFADREEAAPRLNYGTGIQALSQVVADPLSNNGNITEVSVDGFFAAALSTTINSTTATSPTVTTTTDVQATAFTWARPYTIVQAYARAGNARIGDIEFLPQLSTVRYGKTTYLSGSAVRCYDGIQLGDAGFQDYPLISAGVAAAGGSMSAGLYQFTAYLVRYNARGERFQSAGLTFPSTGPFPRGVTVAANGKVTLTINTVPDTNHADCQIEVYRTIAGGTSFYLDGTVANDLTQKTVTYVCTQSDATLATQPGDPFQTGVGNISEIESWGPLGCAVLAVVGDRMWGCGGQVPAGFAQFSKLKEPGSAVGFDDLGGLEEVNCLGNAIYSIVGYGDAVIFLEADRIDVLAGTGPDNDGIGSWGVPQMVLTDGATTHYGTIVTQAGVGYWGDGGPRLLTPAFRVENISLPIRSLTESLTPTGVRVDLARKEVVWYTQEGTAVLWNYAGEQSRWAKWTGLPVAGVSDAALIESDGWLLTPGDAALGDAGRVFEFSGCTSEVALGALGGAQLLRSLGFVGAHLGDHQLLTRVYYNGSPLWTDEWTWRPDTNTWLTAGTDVSTLTPAEVDALLPVDHSGQYANHKRVSRPDCRTFRVEWSDINSDTPTFTPYELSLEVGTKGGLGRVAVNSYGG